MRIFKLLCLFSIVTMLFSCKDEEKGFVVDDENISPSTEEPVNDKMSVKSDLLTYVYPANYSEVASCMINRMTQKTGKLDDEVKTVILHNKNISELTESDYVNLLNVYANNGSLMIVEPTIPEWNKFIINLTNVIDTIKTEYPAGLYQNAYALIYAEDSFDKNDENQTIYVSDGGEDSADEHFYDIIGLRSNDVYYVVDIHDKDKLVLAGSSSKGGDTVENSVENNETTTKEEMSEYRYGLVADQAVTWINSQIIHEKAPTLKFANHDDVVNAQSAQTYSYSFVAPAYKIPDLTERMASCQVSYQVWAFNDLKTHDDYYLVHEIISANNKDLNCEYDKDSKWMNSSKFDGKKNQKFYGPYMGYILSEPSLSVSNGETVTLSDVSPGTSIGSSSTSSGFNWNFGGQLGYGTMALNTGIDFSQSWTTNTSDLTIEQNNLGTNPSWKYVGADVKAYQHVFSVYHRQAAPIQKNTCTVNNSWIWKVSNPKGSYKLNSRVTYSAQYTRMDYNFFYYTTWYPYHWSRFVRNFTMTPPPRYKDVYLLTCHTISGDKEIEDYIAKHYPTYWKNELELVSVTESDITPAINFVKELVSLIYGDSSRWEKDQKEGTYRIEIRKKFSNKVEYEQEFSI